MHTHICMHVDIHTQIPETHTCNDTCIHPFVHTYINKSAVYKQCLTDCVRTSAYILACMHTYIYSYEQTYIHLLHACMNTSYIHTSELYIHPHTYIACVLTSQNAYMHACMHARMYMHDTYSCLEHDDFQCSVHKRHLSCHMYMFVTRTYTCIHAPAMCCPRFAYFFEKRASISCLTWLTRAFVGATNTTIPSLSALRHLHRVECVVRHSETNMIMAPSPRIAPTQTNTHVFIYVCVNAFVY
jgi:hypothetical protein